MSKIGEHLFVQVEISPLTSSKVLDVDVGELRLQLLSLGDSLLLADVMTDVDLLVVQKHTVDGLDSGIGGFSSLVVDKTVTSRLAILVESDFAGENVTEGSEGVVKSLFPKEEEVRTNQPHAIMTPRTSVGLSTSTHLVVNSLIQVLDEDVSLRTLPQSRVTLRPHDPAGSSLDQRVVETVERSFTRK